MNDTPTNRLWLQPPPVRANGFTWLTWKLVDGNPDVVVTLNIEELTDRLIHATDRLARREIIERLADRDGDVKIVGSDHAELLAELLDYVERLLDETPPMLRPDIDVAALRQRADLADPK